MSVDAIVWSTCESPIGELTLVARDARLRQVRFAGNRGGLGAEARRPGELAEAERQLRQYFAGERRSFDLELELVGSELQRRVWTELRGVPFGETVSYGELAKRVGLERPEAARDIGTVVGQTPTPVVVPCHRVIGANGDLVGYGGGLDRKRTLLDLEASQLSLL
jgi:methylated-DNA-[protein]-cysteine S-methyltransferase